MKMLHTSKTCFQVLGIEAKDFEPGINFEITHPDDMIHHSLSRTRLIKLANEIYIKGEKYVLGVTNVRFRHTSGQYKNFLVQAFIFTSQIPSPTVYAFTVHTDIDWYGKIKYGYFYYQGQDLSRFRLPDKKLILSGRLFSSREYEIIKLIKDGLKSEEIGKKLFLSTHTINTHRRNITRKTGKSSITELIVELQEMGFL